MARRVYEKDTKGGQLFADESLTPDYSSDEAALAAVGKKPVLKRRFGWLSLLGVSMTIAITWEGLIIVFATALANGGPGGLVWGFIWTWLGYLATAISLGEMASMYPTAGGQYHWVYCFAPARWRKILSYIAGWQTFLYWHGITAAATQLTAGMIQGLAVLNNPDYAPTRWQTTLIMYAVMLVVFSVNAIGSKILPHIEYGILTIHIGAFIGILVPLIYYSKHASAKDVFLTFLSEAGYDGKGLAFFVGLNSATFAFVGVDGAIHLCEEIPHAQTAVPNIIVSTVLMNGTLGLGFLIAILFVVVDYDLVLKTPTGFPFIEIFNQALQSIPKATAMSAFIVAMAFFATISIFAAASRVTWAFARDKGLPGSRWLGSVNNHLGVPFVSCVELATVVILLALINIGSTTVFAAFVSLTNAASVSSFLLSIGLLLYRRLFTPHELQWGPWHAGKFGPFINILALVWGTIAFIFSFFPTGLPVTAQNMNWSIALYGGTSILAALFYIVWARRVYNGPVIETNVATLMPVK